MMTERATRGQGLTRSIAQNGGPVITRFAPSPTGRLHLGHAYSAIRSHDFARTRGGHFVLRIEDTDTARCRPGHVEAIYRDLEWLGLEWDALMIQSERLAVYAAALDRLRQMDLIYPCFCSRADIAREIAASLHAPHGADGPLYPGTCRTAPQSAREGRLASDPHCWRLDAAAAIQRTGPLTWRDSAAGVASVNIAALGDLVLKGRDRPTSYHLAVVVDDAAQGVTDVVRGEDIFASTHAQRILQALLGLPTPDYHHHGLVAGSDGLRLAKRADAPTLEQLRLAGKDGRALAEMVRRGALPIGNGMVTA